MIEQEDAIAKLIKLSELPNGVYVIIGTLDGSRTKAIIEEICDSSTMYQISFSSFMRRYFVPGNILQIDNNGDFNTIIRA